MSLYHQKQRDYFTLVRTDLIQFIPSGSDNKVLEIGAGGGDTLRWIKEKGLATEVVGVELNRLEGSNQSHPSIDKFHFGDLDKDVIDLPLNYFTTIICGDVLEHLINPWETLKKITPHLKVGGTLIVSCPNIRNYKTFVNIFLKGSFIYEEFGLFDKTHLRFFCKKDLVRMVADQGVIVRSATPTFKLIKSNKANTFNRLTLGLFEQFLAVQYVVVAIK